MLLVLALMICVAEGRAEHSPSPSGPTEIGIRIPHPMTMALRDKGVRRELGLAVGQTVAVEAILDEVELPLWRLRDLPPAERNRAAEPLLRQLELKLAGSLTSTQSERFRQPSHASR